MAKLLTYVCRTHSHDTSEDLEDQNFLRDLIRGRLNANRHSFWNSRVDRSSGTYNNRKVSTSQRRSKRSTVDPDTLIQTQPTPQAPDSPLSPLSSTHHNDRQVVAYQRPSQHSTVDPGTLVPGQATPQGYEYSHEILDDRFHVFPSSQRQSDLGRDDGEVEEITVLRTTTRMYRVRRQPDTTRQFYEAPRDSKQSFEGDQPTNSTKFGQYRDDQTYPQKHHGPYFTPEDTGYQQTIPVQRQQTGRPYAGSFHGWVDEVDDDDVNRQQHYHGLGNLGTSQNISHPPNNLEVGRYKGKRLYDDFDHHDDLEESDDIAAVQGGGHAKKMKLLAY